LIQIKTNPISESPFPFKQLILKIRTNIGEIGSTTGAGTVGKVGERDMAIPRVTARCADDINLLVLQFPNEK